MHTPTANSSDALDCRGISAISWVLSLEPREKTSTVGFGREVLPAILNHKLLLQMSRMSLNAVLHLPCCPNFQNFATDLPPFVPSMSVGEAGGVL